jgi:hypothetical protein
MDAVVTGDAKRGQQPKLSARPLTATVNRFRCASLQHPCRRNVLRMRASANGPAGSWGCSARQLFLNFSPTAAFGLTPISSAVTGRFPVFAWLELAFGQSCVSCAVAFKGAFQNPLKVNRAILLGRACAYTQSVHPSKTPRSRSWRPQATARAQVLKS